MRKIICDRCGAEITGDRIGYVAVNWRATRDDSLMQNNPYEHMDFCECCMLDITFFIDDKKSRKARIPRRVKKRRQILNPLRWILNRSRRRRSTRVSTCGSSGSW